MNTQKLSKPVLPKVLEPSKFLLPMDLKKSCLHKLFESRNTPVRTSTPYLLYVWLSSNASSGPKTLLTLTLKLCVGCV